MEDIILQKPVTAPYGMDDMEMEGLMGRRGAEAVKAYRESHGLPDKNIRVVPVREILECCDDLQDVIDITYALLGVDNVKDGSDYRELCTRVRRLITGTDERIGLLDLGYDLVERKKITEDGL